MDWLKRAHLLIALTPWIAAILFRQVWLILICLACHLIVISQWAILHGKCFLNRIENNGISDESEALVQLSDWLQVPLTELKQGVILVNAVAPNFLHLSRLAGALGL